ncbi:MAG: Xaa-Pro peptidase family protein [Thermacetogeniaceae bacterium]
MARRLRLLRKFMAERELKALLVTKLENRRYISGFTGSFGIILITPDEASLLTDGRYGTQAQLEAPGWQVLLSETSSPEALADACRKHGVQELGFEKDDVTYQQFEQFQEYFSGIRLRPVLGLVEKLRLIKDTDEIALLQEAGVITGAAYCYLLGHMHAGQTEQDIASRLEYFMRSRGGGMPAFETIVAAGERGAMPHGRATDSQLMAGQLVVMDFGASYQGYMSDLTRTVCVGRSDAKQRHVYDVVLEAQLSALELIRPGVAANEVDAAARQVITRAGYGDYFTHALGHGIGLNIHEPPRLAPRHEVILKPGMVTSVEPGIYLPGWGGVRIEDTVLVTATGYEILTPVTKDFMVI